MSKPNENHFELIKKWAIERNLYKNGDSKTQAVKLGEEFGELCKAVLKRNDEELYDAVGDCVVVLVNVINLYELERLDITGEPIVLTTIEDCIELAYNTISKRKGKMINGSFVKDAE